MSSPTSPAAATSSKNTLTVVDNRTGKTIEIPILTNESADSFIDATALKKLTLSDETDQHGIMLYDPSFMNTAVAKSKICFIDGDQGILQYRGYRIEDLAERCSFLEVAYLVLFGELPTSSELQEWQHKVMTHSFLHSNLVSLMKNFRYDAHPMGMVISGLSALSTFYDEANPALKGPEIYQKDKALRNKQILRIIGKIPTIAACAYRHRIGRPYNNPRNDLNYTENFLYMLDRLSEADYTPHPKLARALDVLFILHADHEMNCSTAAMRHVASSMVDPYTACSAAASALYGPLHGGANEQVLHMLEAIGTKDNVPAFIERVKRKEVKLMGFGHRVYKNYDPRCTLVKKVAHEVFEICGADDKLRRLYEIAVELEREALSNPYFIERKLYPNIDFYSGLIYRAMGFPTDMYPVLFCIPRCVGWLAHWLEQLEDQPQGVRIFRPRQWYTGHLDREFVPIEKRKEEHDGGVSPDEAKRNQMEIYHSDFGRRRNVSLQWMSENAEFMEEKRRAKLASTGLDMKRRLSVSDMGQM